MLSRISNRIKKILPKKLSIQFIQFCMVGVLNTVISYTIYSISTYCGIYYLLASLLGFFVSVLNSYYWNSKYVFSETKRTFRMHIRAFMRMVLSYGLTGLILQSILLYILVESGISKYFAPFLVMFLTIPLNFLLNKLWAFHK